jgi:transcriptional regulator with XRE-family HTH domain
MSSTELADKVGVSRSYLSSVRKGKNSPSPELVDKIAEALSIPSIFLYERSTSHPLHTYERQVALASFETFVKRTLYKPPTK